MCSQEEKAITTSLVFVLKSLCLPFHAVRHLLSALIRAGLLALVAAAVHKQTIQVKLTVLERGWRKGVTKYLFSYVFFCIILWRYQLFALAVFLWSFSYSVFLCSFLLKIDKAPCYQ